MALSVLRTEERPPPMGIGGASYSNLPPLGYQHTFTMGNGLIPLDFHLQTWRKREVDHLANSLDRALLLPDDMHF